MTESGGFEFDRLTAVSQAGDGRYAAELSPGWVVGGGLNGGYLLAVMGQALRAALPAKPDPIAVTAHYVSASAPGPATVSVDVRRETADESGSSRSASASSSRSSVGGGAH